MVPHEVLHVHFQRKFSDVYKGTLAHSLPDQGVTRDSVALKFYRADLLEDSGQLERIQREADFGRSMSHPNLMKIYELVETRFLDVRLTLAVLAIYTARKRTKKSRPRAT